MEQVIRTLEKNRWFDDEARDGSHQICLKRPDQTFVGTPIVPQKRVSRGSIADPYRATLS